MKNIEIHFAPLQGYTDGVYRSIYDMLFGHVDYYYTPFIRKEKDDSYRRRDIRDLEQNKLSNLVPQILPGSAEEMRDMSLYVSSLGYNRIDINMGCPFPPIVGQKRGCGLLRQKETVSEILSVVDEMKNITFSVKVRLGWESPNELFSLAEILNKHLLCHVAVHARTGKQQYKGECDKESFKQFSELCRIPLVYNGDILSLSNIEEIEKEFPFLKGIMIGRGLLSDPTLLMQLYGIESSSKMLSVFHEKLYQAYLEQLQGGEHQVLTKMKTYWEYFLPNAEHRLLKKIQKAYSLSAYKEAVNIMFKEL